MKLFLISILLVSYLTVVNCSRYIDIHTQKGIHISDYCPKIGNCEEGTHVLCLYYNPNKSMGPTCSNPVNITITLAYAKMILDIVNRIRSKVAKGIAKGGDGVDLPRGYGIYRVEWDEELATFAQLWANQCMMKNDLCRATKKFPSVGQTIGMSRFTIDEWKPINSPHYSNTTTLTHDKVRYAITSVLKAWYAMKKDVDANVISVMDKRSTKILRNQFINIIYGDVTHIGCGISAYREYAYYDNNAALNYNSVQIVCNFSTRLKSGEVYTRDPPTKPGYTVKCGCPLGYDEDEDCLCYESGREMPFSCKDNKSRCRPSLVILPIFKVENAPQDFQKVGNNDTLLMNTNEIFDNYDLLSNRKQDQNHKLIDYKSPNRRSFSKPPNERNPVDVKKRYFNRFESRKSEYYKKNPTQVSNIGLKKKSKQSVFSKFPIFKLSLRKTSPIIFKKDIAVYKIDVTPRKDFSKVHKLVTNYLDKKRNGNSFDTNEGTKDIKFYNKSIKLNVELNNNIQVSTEKVYNYNTTEKRELKMTEGNLMTLLDTLEKEIKEIDLNTDERKLFDNKIRKIYNTLIDQDSSRLINNKNISRDYNKNIKNLAFDDIDRMRNVYNIKRDSETLYNGNFDLNNDDLYKDRRYYDNKLEKLRRKIDLMKRNGYQNVHDSPKLRPVRPTKAINGKRSKVTEPFYVPDRARFLHGF